MAVGKYKKWQEPEMLVLLEGWARDGLTDEQIAKNMGICRDTLYTWKKAYADISDALKKGKEVADYIVENELFKAAQQQIVTIKEPIKVRTEKQKVGSGKVVEEHIEYVEKQIIVPGNVTAQIYWLNNRRPDKWRNSRDGGKGANDSDVIDSFLEVMESEQQ